MSLQSALLDEAEDTLTVENAVHTFIMVHPRAIQAVVRYLETGTLLDEDPPDSCIDTGIPTGSCGLARRLPMRPGSSSRPTCTRRGTDARVLGG